jgi:hypothetical protein
MPSRDEDVAGEGIPSLLNVEAWTEPGDTERPNEDWHFVDQRIPGVVLLDGGTARTGTGCSHGVAWYTQRLGAALRRRLTAGPLPQILRSAIEEVASEHHTTCELNHPAGAHIAYLFGVLIRQRQMQRGVQLSEILRWGPVERLSHVAETVDDGRKFLTTDRLLSRHPRSALTLARSASTTRLYCSRSSSGSQPASSARRSLPRLHGK